MIRSDVAPSLPSVEPLTDEEAFDLRCIRMRNTVLAAQGCGSAHCPPETCLVARHARVILRALDALDAATERLDGPASVRTALDVRTNT